MNLKNKKKSSKIDDFSFKSPVSNEILSSEDKKEDENKNIFQF